MSDKDSLFTLRPVASALNQLRAAVRAQSTSATKKAPKVSELSIAQVLKTTPGVFKENAKNVVIKDLKRGNTRAGFPGVKAVAKDVFSNPGKRGISHKCSIVAMDGKPVYLSKAAYFSCDCSAFLYWCEVALHANCAIAKILN